jgi:hypothetical protein
MHLFGRQNLKFNSFELIRNVEAELFKRLRMTKKLIYLNSIKSVEEAFIWQPVV